MRTRAIVDLGAVCRNYRHLGALVGKEADLMCVVKADAYGHGALAVSRALWDAGARHFAVATLEEAVQLRDGGTGGSVAVLSGLEAGEESEAAGRDVYPMINSREQLARWNLAAARLRRKLPCQLLFNTGLNRLGLDVDPDDSASVATLHADLEGCDWLDVRGAATHYASPEDFGSDQTARQAERFQRQLHCLREANLVPRYIHSCASAAIVHRAGDPAVRADCNMARPGLSLYGYVLRAVGKSSAASTGLCPALEWRARLIALHDLPQGASVGYAASYVTPCAMRVGVLAVGFADGLDRRLAHCGWVMLRSARCPIVGAISMDLTVVDVSAAVGARLGDEAVLLGGEAYDADGMSELIGGIPYEVLCGIKQRVPRQYLGADCDDSSVSYS